MIAAKTYRYAFGLDKQSDIKTAIAAGKFAHMLPVEGFGPVNVDHAVAGVRTHIHVSRQGFSTGMPRYELR